MQRGIIAALRRTRVGPILALVRGTRIPGERRGTLRLAAAALALAPTGCAYVQQWQAELQPGWPSQLICHGDFAQFANGFPVARLSDLHFAVWWTAPAVQPLDGGSPARILSLTPLELSFEVQYQGYKVAYHLNRVDGGFTQVPALGGVFVGRCDIKPLATKI